MSDFKDAIERLQGILDTPEDGHDFENMSAWCSRDLFVVACMSKRLLDALKAARGVMWMAKEYADASSAGGPEPRDYNKAVAEINSVLEQCGEEPAWEKR